MSVLLILAAFAAASPFLEKPYLQLGDNPGLSSKESLALLWQAASSKGAWTVEIGAKGKFRKAAAPAARAISLKGTPPHFVYSAALTGLEPGEEFDYRVLLDGAMVFSARGKARPAASARTFRIGVFGDCGADKAEQREIAALAYKLAPGMVFITGDIVYSRGLVSEYRTKYFPIYNADAASPLAGAPLSRSTVMIAAPGNHDLATRDLDKFPDALAYFYYWAMPLNGVELPMFARLDGAAARVGEFKAAAGANFPRMANFSFDWGNSHWLVLDSNNYVDWSDAGFREWIEADLAGSKATWKFVGFHHPGFNSSKAHFKDQQARLAAPLFEKHGVDVVFSGHVHNYQRSFPLRFEPGEFDLAKSKEVDGAWKLDREFDGVAKTRAKGVIYLVTGAGGNTLYNPEQEGDSGSWQEFTAKFVSKIHSLTDVEITGKRAVFKQYDKNGIVIDRFVVTK